MMKTPGILKGGRCRDCRWRTPSVGCADPVRKSGRCGDWVWYPRGSKQCKRRWVSPRDPRTPGQLRSRAALGAASKEWSHSEKLTEEQREDWRRKAGKVQSRVRLGQSGPLTGQLNYVGRKTEKAEPISQVPQSEKAAQSMWEQYDHSTIAPVWQRRRGGESRSQKGCFTSSAVPESCAIHMGATPRHHARATLGAQQDVASVLDTSSVLRGVTRPNWPRWKQTAARRQDWAQCQGVGRLPRERREGAVGPRVRFR